MNCKFERLSLCYRYGEIHNMLAKIIDFFMLVAICVGVPFVLLLMALVTGRCGSLRFGRDHRNQWFGQWVGPDGLRFEAHSRSLWYVVKRLWRMRKHNNNNNNNANDRRKR